jgi:REP element-mobilizing transposase RayT
MPSSSRLCDRTLAGLKGSMPQSLAQIYLHVVFSTKQRRAYLQSAELCDELHKYLGGVCRNLDAPSLIVGGAVDHVHVLRRFSRTITLADFVRELKRDSSKWLKTKSHELADFHWQDGYGAFSISPSHVEALRRYIANQRAHHEKESFQDEFRRLLKKYGVEYDERYVWD